MNKVDPIIAVHDVLKSSAWYQRIFGCKGLHGGDHFEILEDENGDIFLCLHQWGRDDHPTMMAPSQPGNGLILYLRTDNIETIYANAAQSGDANNAIHLNPNSGKQEFSLQDPDGYFWIVSEAHDYGG